MLDHIRRIAANDVAHNRSSADMRNASSQMREAHEAARAAALAAAQQKK